MSNFWKQQVAQESANTAGADDNISNIEAPEQNLEHQMTEMQSEDAALDQLMNDNEVLQSDMATTENAIEKSAGAMDDGDELSEKAAAHIEVGQESIARRWGIARTRVARESFRSGRGATRIAHEGWKETLKALWKRLVALIETIVNKTKDLKLKVINVGKSAVARSKKFEEALGKLGKKKNDDISGGWMAKLAIEGKVDAEKSAEIAADIVSGGKTATALAAMAAVVGSAAEYTVAENDGEVKFSSGGKEIEFNGEVAKKLRILPGFEAEDGASIEPHKVIALPGNGYIQSATKKMKVGKDGTEEDLTVVAYFSSSDKAEDSTIPTPSAAELRKANVQLKKIGENYEKVLKDFRKQDETMSKLKEAAKKKVAEFDKSKDDDRNHLRNARQIANDAITSVQATQKAVHGVARGVIGGLSGYIGAGIGAYEKAKA